MAFNCFVDRLKMLAVPALPVHVALTANPGALTPSGSMLWSGCLDLPFSSPKWRLATVLEVG